MNIKETISQLTLEEKAGLCSGGDFWHTKAVERLGIPAMMMSDGPHGLRKQDETSDNMGINESIKAVCFPAGCAAAASFDRELIEKMGQALGNECQAENIAVLLGPAVNIKRSPLCGRNFEYYSEDPLVASETAKALMPNAEYQLPYEGAKEMLLVEDIENRDFLKELFEAMYVELPEPKKRK